MLFDSYYSKGILSRTIKCKVKEKGKIKNLYSKLLSNRITEPELEEFLSLLEREEGRILSEAEMKKLWDRIPTAQLNPELQNEIHAFKEQVKYGSGIVHEKFWDRIGLRMVGMVAASLVVLISFVFLSGILSDQIEYKTSYGEREKITLPDGSVVELNANTTLVWDKNWKERRIRQVTLDGEAFFEVKHTDDHATFLVRTNDLDVEVLGTSFNVSNRVENTKVYLEDGSVRLKVKGNNPQEILMTPGHKITYSRAEDLLIEEKELNPETAASWKNDVLYFNNKKVEEILREVSELYGVQFEYNDPDIRERKLNFWVPYSDWETTKEAFELTMNLEIKEKEGVYVVGKK